MGKFQENEVPYFCWDRSLTAGAIRQKLAGSSGFAWAQTAAWIMREAAFADVWQFLRPQEVRGRLEELRPLLGRRRGFWAYILGAWHELGRI